MANIQFTVTLAGGDQVELPVSSVVPGFLSQAGGPTVITFDVTNTLQRSVVLENVAAVVVVGDASLVDLSMLDTVLSLAEGEVKPSSLTVTPNQPIYEGTTLEIEVTGAEA